MNLLHGWLCSSKGWASVVRKQMIPWALEGVRLGKETLEIGPGYGATTRALLERGGSLTAIELDERLAARLDRTLGDRCRVVRGDGAAMPFAGGAFDTVTCFAMLHHVPSTALQDRLFAEAFRVLRPGGSFVGADSLPSVALRLFHVLDTMVLVDPTTLPARLERAGFRDVEIATLPKRALRFTARKPEEASAPG